MTHTYSYIIYTYTHTLTFTHMDSHSQTHITHTFTPATYSQGEGNQLSEPACAGGLRRVLTSKLKLSTWVVEVKFTNDNASFQGTLKSHLFLQKCLDTLMSKGSTLLRSGPFIPQPSRSSRAPPYASSEPDLVIWRGLS